MAPPSTPRKAVGGPFFAADAVMDEEEAVGIVLRLDLAQAWIVRSPERVPPCRVEIVTLRNIGPCAGAIRRNSAAARSIACASFRAAVSSSAGRGRPGKRGPSPSAMTASANASVTARIGGRISRRRDGIVGRAGQSLAELQLDFLVPAGCEQRVREAQAAPLPRARTRAARATQSHAGTRRPDPGRPATTRDSRARRRADRGSVRGCPRKSQ